MVRENVISELCEDPKVEVGTEHWATIRPSRVLSRVWGAAVG